MTVPARQVTAEISGQKNVDKFLAVSRDFRSEPLPAVVGCADK